MIFSSPCSMSGNGVERRYLQQWMNCACSILYYWCVYIQCLCILTYSVCMDLNDEKVPLAMVWSLLSYSESKLRLWRSWNASTRRHAILLAFNNLVIKMVIQMLQVTDDGSNDKALFSRMWTRCEFWAACTHSSCRENNPSKSPLEISAILFPYSTLWRTNTTLICYE